MNELNSNDSKLEGGSDAIVHSQCELTTVDTRLSSRARKPQARDMPRGVTLRGLQRSLKSRAHFTWLQTGRVHLTIDKKVEVIKYAAERPGVGVRAIGEHFKIGKTQVSTILWSKDSIQTSFETNLVTTNLKSRNSKFSSVNEAL